MEIRPIKTKADYRRALKELEELMSARRGTPKGDRLDVLVALIQAYEAKHHPMNLSDPSRQPTRLPKHRAPTPPGEMLLNEFLEPLGLTQVALAAKMGVPTQRLNAIIKGRRAVTAETAILLSRALATAPEFWLELQMVTDLWAAHRRLSARDLP